MALGLPIDDVKEFVDELIDELGSTVIVDDNTETKMIISDFARKYHLLHESMKQCAVKKEVPIKIGSKIENLLDGSIYIVYTQPSDDLVSQSCRVLTTNSEIIVRDKEYIYDENTGDIIDKRTIIKDKVRGYVERKTGNEKNYDFGTVHQSSLEFITYDGANLNINDVVEVKDKKFKIVDVNDITDGLLILKLVSEHHG